MSAAPTHARPCAHLKHNVGSARTRSSTTPQGASQHSAAKPAHVAQPSEARSHCAAQRSQPTLRNAAKPAHLQSQRSTAQCALQHWRPPPFPKHLEQRSTLHASVQGAHAAQHSTAQHRAAQPSARSSAAHLHGRAALVAGLCECAHGQDGQPDLEQAQVVECGTAAAGVLVRVQHVHLGKRARTAEHARL